jgi:hypothetical protein
MLLRPNSVLRVSYAYSDFARWDEIVKPICGYSLETSAFFASDTGFSWLSDLCELGENEDGDAGQ